MEIFLTNAGCVIPYSNFQKHRNVAAFLAEHTITTPQKVGPPKVAKLCKIGKIGNVLCLYIPKFIALSLTTDGKFQIAVMYPPIKPVEYISEIKLDRNQQLVVDYLVDEVFTEANRVAGRASTTLNMRAGYGKTFVAGGIIAALGVRTLYIVPNRPLLVQVKSDLGSLKNKINIYSKETASADDDVTVIVINSALKQPDEFFAGYSLIIFDEIHMYCAEMRREIFWKAHSHYNLGLSATTDDRGDHFDPVFHNQIGPILMADGIEKFAYDTTKFICGVDAVYYSGPDEYTHNLTHESTGKIFTPYMHKQFSSDPYRNQLIIDSIMELYNWRQDGKCHNIFIFCEERDYVTALYGHLTKLVRDVDAPEIAEFIGGIKDSRIREIKEKSRILITTYGYSGVGVSINKMTAIVFATPRRSNMKQTLGRVIRRDGDVSIPRVYVDIIDKKTGLARQFNERKLSYLFYNMTINKRKVHYTDIKLAPATPPAAV